MSVASKRNDRARIGRAERRPCASGQCELFRQDRPARLEERTDLLGLELAEALEGRAPGERADTDQRRRARTLLPRRAADAVEQLDQVELIEEVVLEPEHELVVARDVVDRGAPTLELGDHVADAVCRIGEVTSAHRDQLAIRRTLRHRPIVERIGPDRTRAGQPGALDQRRGRRPVGDVVIARHGVLR